MLVSPEERVDQALRSSRLALEKARNVLGDAAEKQRIAHAAGQEARARAELLCAKARVEIAALQNELPGVGLG